MWGYMKDILAFSTIIKSQKESVSESATQRRPCLFVANYIPSENICQGFFSASNLPASNLLP